jgi:hypothetical protein
MTTINYKNRTTIKYKDGTVVESTLSGPRSTQGASPSETVATKPPSAPVLPPRLKTPPVDTSGIPKSKAAEERTDYGQKV